MPYAALVRSDLTLFYGMDMGGASAKEGWTRAVVDPQYHVINGLGSIVALLAKGLPILVNTTATRIDTPGDGAIVETTAGPLRARVCLLTVSTGALNAGKITFTPDLSVGKQEAIADIPRGVLMEIQLICDGARLLGSAARKHVKNGFSSDRADNPHDLDAYGVVKPGAFQARQDIGKPIDDNLFFGGKAAVGALKNSRPSLDKSPPHRAAPQCQTNRS